MLKRRQLGKSGQGQNGQNQPQQKRQAQAPQSQGNQQPGQQRGQQARNPQPQGNRDQGSQNRGGGRGRRKRNRGRGGQQQRQQRKPQPPPDYIQRDLLLIANGEGVKGIEEVRAKFDPLAKKIPAHVTLLFPEPAEQINREFLKTLPTLELPSLQSLIFNKIEVHEDMYLWLMPDEESKNRLQTWHEALVGKLENHTQEETYHPHLTLGYVPRSMTGDDAIAFARNLIATPVSLNFEKILLEEFGENQISTPVDTAQLH